MVDVLIIIGLECDFMIVANPFQIIRRIVVILIFNELWPQYLGWWTLVNWARMFRNPRLRLKFILSSLSDLHYGFLFLFLLSGDYGLLRWVLVQHLKEIRRKV